MALDDARKLHDTIIENEDLQKEFEGLESQDEVIDKALEIAGEKGFNVSRGDIEALFKVLDKKTEEMNGEDLENVAGGDSERGGDEPGSCCLF